MKPVVGRLVGSSGILNFKMKAFSMDRRIFERFHGRSDPCDCMMHVLHSANRAILSSSLSVASVMSAYENGTLESPTTAFITVAERFMMDVNTWVRAVGEHMQQPQHVYALHANNVDDPRST